MNEVIERNAEKIISKHEADQLKRATEFRLSDAIREGASVSKQAFNWTGSDDSMCALSAAVASATARGYL